VAARGRLRKSALRRALLGLRLVALELLVELVGRDGREDGAIEPSPAPANTSSL
jgi:hypothetical protein